MPYTITTCLAVSQGISCIRVILWSLLDCKHGWRLYIQFIVFGFGVFSSRVTTAVLAVSLLLLQTKDSGNSHLNFFLIIYAVFNWSKLMKYSSRSTEETFGNFISIALTVDAMKHLAGSFKTNYNNNACAVEDLLGQQHHNQINESSAIPLLSALTHNSTKRAAEIQNYLPYQRNVPYCT